MGSNKWPVLDTTRRRESIVWTGRWFQKVVDLSLLDPSWNTLDGRKLCFCPKRVQKGVPGTTFWDPKITVFGVIFWGQNHSEGLRKWYGFLDKKGVREWIDGGFQKCSFYHFLITFYWPIIHATEYLETNSSWLWTRRDLGVSGSVQKGGQKGVRKTRFFGSKRVIFDH